MRKGYKDLTGLPVAWIAKPAVLPRRLGVMAALAQRLPVRLVPKQRLIALVRDDVIHHRGWHDTPVTLAQGAQRVRCQEHCSCPPPARAVAPGSGTAAPVITLFPRLSLVLSTIPGYLQ